MVTRFLPLVICLLCCSVLGQVDQDPYEGSYQSQYIESLTEDYSLGSADADSPSIHYWQTDLLISQGVCSGSPNATWVTGDNICNGTSYQSCMPEWPGIIHFKDLTPEGSEAMNIQFELFGSFGCGNTNGQVDYTLNGVGSQNSRFIYHQDFHCGCGLLDSDLLSEINLNDTKWEDSYFPGDWNSFEIKADAGVNLCLCGISIHGSYFGLGDPLETSSDYSSSNSATGVWWAVATLFSLCAAILVVAGIIYFYSRKRKLAKEADEFDVEFGDE